ncbi:hypothetical protein Purlil1_1582 [Purpureocillium lilacinum]|uniref:Uncharacterized protein n=1 Tax=Purpureocillium lilacinum TaxID=33203 RepID=A0ABR0CCF1_PURLI|nr:hypothetical protein Purlil1_1582 [Purpureocillium lilacinum]
MSQRREAGPDGIKSIGSDRLLAVRLFAWAALLKSFPRAGARRVHHCVQASKQHQAKDLEQGYGLACQTRHPKGRPVIPRPPPLQGIMVDLSASLRFAKSNPTARPVGRGESLSKTSRLAARTNMPSSRTNRQVQSGHQPDRPSSSRDDNVHEPLGGAAVTAADMQTRLTVSCAPGDMCRGVRRWREASDRVLTGGRERSLRGRVVCESAAPMCTGHVARSRFSVSTMNGSRDARGEEIR